ncbi:DMT family transporter [Ideonella sp. YS5]|uniref:DMT family transporter n=1 Tax=Ideonella sp. YS5 TaxID=3453714 RepID=UPI003EED4160
MRSAFVKMTLATLLFGSYLVASKLILREAPVFTATLVRLASAALFLALVVGLRRGPPWRAPSARDAALLLAQSGVGVFLFSLCAMQGVRLTGGIESGVILSLVPIAVSLVAVLFLGERLTTRRSLGILLSVTGAAVISALATHGAPAAAADGASSEGAWWGIALLLCAVGCEAVFLTFGRFLSRPLPPDRLSLVVAGLGALMFVVPAAIEPQGLMHAEYSWRTWALMAYTGVAINGVAAVLIYDSMGQVDATVAGAFTALTPVSGTVLAMVFLGESLHAHHLLGMALVIAGVFLVAATAAMAKREEPEAPASEGELVAPQTSR